ncbi:AAA family ATPase [Flavobacterium sp. 3-218]
MTKTLLTRISILSQYNSKNKTILWEDPANNRWENIYGQLVENDNAIFISNDKLLIGKISEVNYGKSLLCINIEEINCQNDQFLRLHNAYPELISRVKANFQPFIHPIQLDLNQLIIDARNQNFINFYIISSQEKYIELSQSFRENDRIVLLDANHSFQNVKSNSKEGLIDFPKELDIKISIEGLVIDEVLQKNKNYKRKSVKSNNVSRIEKIKKEIHDNGIFKFTSFFTYHDTLFNKRVYQKKEGKSKSNIVNLSHNESIFKVSMSPKDIDDKAFNFFNNNYLIIVHSQTKAKGVSSQTQGETFRQEMKIGDYFYMCRGNYNLEVIGRITSDASYCEYEDYGDDGWLQRSYEIVSEAIKEEPYNDDKKWWTPNDNSTCIIIPNREIEEANSKLFIPYFDTQFEVKTQSLTTNNINKIMPKNLNLILYGPPGTGKTHKLKHDFFSQFIESSKAVSKEEFLIEKISKLTWWQVIALTLYVENKQMSVPQIKEHQFIKIKLNASNTESIDQTLWGQLSQHTIKESKTVDYTKRTYPLIFNKFPNSLWKIIPEKKELITDICELGNEIKNYTNKLETKNNYEFITFHQSFTYEDFIEGIKPRLNVENQESSDLSYFVRDGLFYKCCDEAAKLAGFSSLSDCILNYNKEQRKEKFIGAPPFGLFIDEINRGNVSSIFGELITLIEAEKRLTKDEIIVKLPYSERYFSVPPNLFIIGTMNTADRSVEALDAALRRRFCFEEMPPDYNLEGLENEIFGHKAFEILEKINLRIEKLLDKDHKIGHSYLLNKDENSIIDSFYNNIIPLLQEYFFGDYSKIGLVLGKGFVCLKESNKDSNIFAKFDDLDNDFEDRNIYEIIDHRFKLDEKMKFGQAIQDLMNK